MEILSPQSLWSGYDRKALPLNPSVITRKEEDGIVSERLYFSGERTATGVTRVFARLWIPQEANPPVVVVMDDLGKDIDNFDASEYLESGYAVLVVDYAGYDEKKERFTIYPKELAFAVYSSDPNGLKEPVSNPKLSCWYIWTTVLLRAVTFAESDLRLGDSIAIVGIGTGGSQVFKAAAIEENLKCGVTLFATNPVYDTSEEDINFKACMYNSGYVPLANIPLLSAICSNDISDFFDRMSGIYAGAGDRHYLSVAERVSNIMLPRQRECVKAFLRRYLKMGLPLGIEPPQITAKESERSLYYEITADTKLAVDKVELFVAYSVETPAFRNWRGIKVLSVGEGGYIAKVPVYDATRPVYAFASVTYADGFTFSTPLSVKTPALLGVQASNFVKNRLLYDSDSGTDDFVSPRGGDDIVMKKGAYDIEGVTSLSGELATFKLGDVQFRADGGSILQLIVFAETERELEFIVCTARHGAGVEYVCRKKTENGGNWTKFTLGADEFKSCEGTLDSFADAVYFSLRGDKVLLNSMLWV